MNSIIEEMLAQHESTTLTDKKNSIKESCTGDHSVWSFPFRSF